VSGARPRAVVLLAGEGEHIDVGPSHLTIKADSATTGGAVFLSETVLAPGFPGPPPHTHERLYDMFYVVEGVLSLQIGDDSVEAGPGAFACVPPGTVHTFANRSDRPVRFLNMNTPAGFEQYMRDLGAAFAGEATPTPDQIGRIASRYDFRPA
jgi:mannose-6-phosphate isomerase-like protein (cupin superfamily)